MTQNPNNLSNEDIQAGYSTIEGPYNPKTGQLKRPVLYNTKPAKIPKTTSVVDPDEPAVFTARSESDIQKEKLEQAQGIIGNLNKYYDTLVGEERTLGESNLRKTNAISALTGLSGSSEANFDASTTEKNTSKQVERVNQERQIKINEILTGIRTSAAEQARQEREEARLSEQDRIAYKEKSAAKSVEQLTMLSKSASGATLEGIRTTLGDDQYNKLVENVGGEAMAQAILFENRPKDTVMGNPTLVGGKMVQAYQTPEGKVKYENVDLPVGVTPDNIQSIEKTDAGIFIINKDGTWKKITGSAKPTTGTGAGVGIGTGAAGDISHFSQPIQDAAQAIYSGKSKLTEYPSKDRLLINSAAQILYNQEGGNELAQGAYDAILGLEDHPGFEHAVGTNILFGYGKNASGTQSAGFLKQLDSLKASIKLVNIKYLKGTGALSDAEGKTLEDAGTSLSTKLPEKQFKKELARVKAALVKANNIRTKENSNISPDGTALQTNGAPTAFSITTPDGQMFSFPNQQALDEFKKAAKL